jgi:hypothetical protein
MVSGFAFLRQIASCTPVLKRGCNKRQVLLPFWLTIFIEVRPKIGVPYALLMNQSIGKAKNDHSVWKPKRRRGKNNAGREHFGGFGSAK